MLPWSDTTALYLLLLLLQEDEHVRVAGSRYLFVASVQIHEAKLLILSGHELTQLVLKESLLKNSFEA